MTVAGEAVEAVIRVETSNIGVITIEGWTISRGRRGHSNNMPAKPEKSLCINLDRMRVKKMTVVRTQREGTDKIEVEVAREANTSPEVAKEAAVGAMTTIGEVIREVEIEVVANINNVEEVEAIAITTSVKVLKIVIITTLLLTP